MLTFSPLTWIFLPLTYPPIDTCDLTSDLFTLTLLLTLTTHLWPWRLTSNIDFSPLIVMCPHLITWHLTSDLDLLTLDLYLWHFTSDLDLLTSDLLTSDWHLTSDFDLKQFLTQLHQFCLFLFQHTVLVSVLKLKSLVQVSYLTHWENVKIKIFNLNFIFIVKIQSW